MYTVRMTPVLHASQRYTCTVACTTATVRLQRFKHIKTSPMSTLAEHIIPSPLLSQQTSLSIVKYMTQLTLVSQAPCVCAS